MGRNIFTSYIIRNRLNLETFFEPIIDFIEIGENSPRRTVYEIFPSYSSSKTTQITKILVRFRSQISISNKKFEAY